MELDTKRKKLRHFVNGEDQGIAVDKDSIQIDENEFIAVITMNDAVTVKVLRFQQKDEQNDRLIPIWVPISFIPSCPLMVLP